jgi:hypothetical protein
MKTKHFLQPNWLLTFCFFSILIPCKFCNFLLGQNLYWADSGDLVAISSDTSFYILKYNVSILIDSIFL